MDRYEITHEILGGNSESDEQFLKIYSGIEYPGESTINIVRVAIDTGVACEATPVAILKECIIRMNKVIHDQHTRELHRTISENPSPIVCDCKVCRTF